MVHYELCIELCIELIIMQLFYRKYGDPKNKPIVVIFGLLGVSENWDFFGKRFAELGYYVLYQLPRHHN